MFHARKGLNDIRMVYNGTSCVLNRALWAPRFGLPIFQHTLCALLPGYLQYDMDMGEMFLNFPIQPQLRIFPGEYIAHIQSRLDEEVWDQFRTRV